MIDDAKVSRHFKVLAWLYAVLLLLVVVMEFRLNRIDDEASKTMMRLNAIGARMEKAGSLPKSLKWTDVP